MIVSFEFIYTHKNRILGDLLEFYAKKSGLNFSLNDNGEKITLFIEGSQDEVLNFSDNYMKLIPNSVFLQSSAVKVVESFGEYNFKSSGLKFNNLTPSVVYNFSENEGEICENEFGIISEISVFYGGKFVAVTSENFAELLSFTHKHLSHYQSVIIKNTEQEIALNCDINFAKSSLIIPTNPLAIPKMFAPDEKSINALATYEKPAISLKINAIFRKNHADAPEIFDCKLPEDIFIYALCAKLYNDNIFFLGADFRGEIFKISVSESDFTIINHGKFLTPQDKKFLESKNDKNLALFGLIANEFGVLDKKILSINLSKIYADYFKILENQSEIKCLKIKIPQNFETIAQKIKENEIGFKLFENFSQNFSFPGGEISGVASFCTIFEIASKILFNQNSEFLIKKAAAYSGEKGVRLDFKLENKTDFDIISLIKSAMSYRLAGVDEKLLCFGFMDSLAYFISDFMDVLSTDFDFEVAIFTGSLFSEKKFANLLKTLVFKNHNAKFSNQYGLEI